MSNRQNNNKGFSLAETTVILGVLSVLSAVATPNISGYVSQARAVRAQSDMRTIASGVVRLVFDTTPQRGRPHGWATYDLLVGHGATPGTTEAADATWIAERDDVKVGLLDSHLVTNDVHYTTRSSAYASHIAIAAGWRGPYLEAGVGSDPWGSRYAVNIKALATLSLTSAVVFSAGANGLVETARDSQGMVPGGDDVIALIGGMNQ